MDQSPPPPDRQTPRPYRPRKKRDRDTAEKILASAALLMPDQGYENLTMRDLAQHAGIGLGTVYGHYASKEKIALRLVARGVDAVHTEMSAVLHSSEAPGRRLYQLLVARVVLRQQQTRGQRYPINEATPALAPALAPWRALWRERERRMLAHVVHEGQVAGMMVYRSFQDIAQTLLWATDGLVAEALGTEGVWTVTETFTLDLTAAARGSNSEGDYDRVSDPLDILEESLLDPEELALKTQRVADLLVSGLKTPQGHEHSY